MRRVNFYFVLLLMCVCQVLSAQARQSTHAKSVSEDAKGQRIFAASCAACHGLDGRGSERGPDIAGRNEVQRLPDARLRSIVEQGVPGTGMPAFGSLGAADIQAVVQHLRRLQGQSSAASLPGNPKSGKSLFFGTAGCARCHMISGEGGFIASDLSGYAGSKSIEEIRTAITDPNKNLDPPKRTVIVTTADGQSHTGIARNEDNFSLQLQTLDGTFHLFSKSELKNIERQSGSLMPDDYQSKLKPQELNDLVSYLMSTAQRNPEELPEKE